MPGEIKLKPDRTNKASLLIAIWVEKINIANKDAEIYFTY